LLISLYNFFNLVRFYQNYTTILFYDYRTTDWNRAIEYYRRILRDNSNDKTEDAGYVDILSTDCEPSYIIISRIAEMYMSGENGVEKNLEEAADLFTEAAEKAIQFGKGRLANKYYVLAEHARS
jgi:elongation factor 2 kinase